GNRIDCPSQRAQSVNQTPVIAVATGRRVDVAGDGEVNPASHDVQIAASYQARATWLSCNWTRIFLMRPPSLSFPERTAAARASNMYLQRNSVVVIFPAKPSTSSRFL